MGQGNAAAVHIEAMVRVELAARAGIEIVLGADLGRWEHMAAQSFHWIMSRRTASHIHAVECMQMFGSSMEIVLGLDVGRHATGTIGEPILDCGLGFDDIAAHRAIIF